MFAFIYTGIHDDPEFTLFLFGVGALIWIIGAFVRARRSHSWVDISQYFGFELERGFFKETRLVGEYEGIEVAITKGTGAFVLRARLRQDTPSGLAVIPKKVLDARSRDLPTAVTTRVGTIDVGLSYLEEACRVWGDDEVEVRRYLSRPGIEDMLLELFSSTVAYVDEGELVYAEPGTGEYAFEFEEPLERMARVVRVLDGDADAVAAA